MSYSSFLQTLLALSHGGVPTCSCSSPASMPQQPEMGTSHPRIQYMIQRKRQQPVGSQITGHIDLGTNEV